MSLFDLFKKNQPSEETDTSSNEIKKYCLIVKTHLYGDEDEEEARNNIIEEIKGDDSSSKVTIEINLDEKKKAEAAGDEEKMFPLELTINAETTLSERDLISCISVHVFDLYITDEFGRVVYEEEDLIED